MKIDFVCVFEGRFVMLSSKLNKQTAQIRIWIEVDLLTKRAKNSFSKLQNEAPFELPAGQDKRKNICHLKMIL